MVDPGILRKELESVAPRLHRRMSGFPEMDDIQEYVQCIKDTLEGLVQRMNAGEKPPRAPYAVPAPGTADGLGVAAPPPATVDLSAPPPPETPLAHLDFKVLQDVAKKHGVPHHKMRRERIISHLQEKGVFSA